MKTFTRRFKRVPLYHQGPRSTGHVTIYATIRYDRYSWAVHGIAFPIRDKTKAARIEIGDDDQNYIRLAGSLHSKLFATKIRAIISELYADERDDRKRDALS
jgi:hypothetical protein